MRWKLNSFASIDLLADEGVHLAEPFSRQLSGKLRELRFHLGRRQVRITYFIATGHRIVLLTVIANGRPQERREVRRAEEAMRRCIEQAHPLRRTDNDQELGRDQGFAGRQPRAASGV